MKKPNPRRINLYKRLVKIAKLNGNLFSSHPESKAALRALTLKVLNRYDK